MCILEKLKRLLSKPHEIFSLIFFDPWNMLKRWWGVYYLLRNATSYKRANIREASFPLSLKEVYYRSYDRFTSAGSVPEHYFLQDIWAATYLYRKNISSVVDVGSRLDGYISHLLVFCQVTYVDIRPLSIDIANLKFIPGNITSLPFEDESVSILTSLHVIEHIGLGRYGDPIDPRGHRAAATELARVLAPGGILIVSTVVGFEKLRFDAHRIFSPNTVLEMFSNLDLESFNLIDDDGREVFENSELKAGEECNYGCGIFVFTKAAGPK
jgi:SAM-dependent methyltransferase